MESMQEFPDKGQRSDDPNIIRFGPLFIDLAGFQVTVHGRDVRLTLAEFLILVELARHPYQVRGRPALATALKQHGPPFNTTQPTQRAFDTHVSRLRSKLRKAQYDCIKTMRFVGYRFAPDGIPSAQKPSTQPGKGKAGHVG